MRDSMFMKKSYVERWLINFSANLIAGLIAYTHFEKKPAIKGIQSLAACF
ncbi:MAG: hypothetical protein JWM09_663 [Francisellaceae bacterium]|nr:hypothetical protein [Francisellaceae bacterium]